MNKSIKFIILLALLLSVSAFKKSDEPPIGQEWVKMMREVFKKYPYKKDNPQFQLYRGLIEKEPETFAADSAKKGNYKLIGYTGGYHAEEKDVKIIGVKCSKPVEHQSIIEGCMVSPPVFYKLIIRYNRALLSQAGSPYKDICSEDRSMDAEIERLEEHEKQRAKEEAQEIKKHDEAFDKFGKENYSRLREKQKKDEGAEEKIEERQKE